MTKVKICGITNLEDASTAARLGADSIGFSFYVNGPRYISPGAAHEIVAGLYDSIDKVGVFVNSPIDEVIQVSRLSGIDTIQLHGDEDTTFVDVLREMTDCKIIKVFRVGERFDQSVIGGYSADAILVDSFSTTSYGGTGKTCNWTMARSLADTFHNVYLAGGLTPGNVGDAIKAVRPFAVDVASGVESAKGKKDPVKLREFIHRAKAIL